jgi:putative transposase
MRDLECVLGAVVDRIVALNGVGSIVEATWYDLPNHYPHVELDEFIIMHNHVHGIIVLTEESISVGETGLKSAPTGKRHGLTEIVRGFKTFSARRINEMRYTVGVPFWQRGYYEHVIRNDRSLDRIREYILNNPYNWDTDEDNPNRIEDPAS